MKNRTARRSALALCTLLLFGSAVLLTGCGGNEGNQATPPPADSQMPEASPTTAEEMPPEGDGTPAETLATSGEDVYAAECAECHGEQGEGLVGPALLGDGTNLAAYGTGRELYDYVHLAMPQDAPGSLTDQQYLEVVTHILLEDGLVEPDTPLSVEGLNDIPLQ